MKLKNLLLTLGLLLGATAHGAIVYSASPGAAIPTVAPVNQ